MMKRFDSVRFATALALAGMFAALAAFGTLALWLANHPELHP